jgi:hypothetical protein
VLLGAAAYGMVVSPGLNIFTLVLALPLHLTFLHHLWVQKRQPPLVLLVLAPLALLGLMLTQHEAIRFLAGSGLALGAVQFFMSREMKAAGLKNI